MEIERIYSALVKPSKEEVDIPITELKRDGDLFSMLNSIFQKSKKECSTPIIFRTLDQTNEVRSFVISILQTREEDHVVSLFKRLSISTPKISGDGLCFLILATDGDNKVFFLSRFPTEEAIRTSVTEEGLNVEMIKDIFIKSQRSYKAVLYSHTSFEKGFFHGNLVDKQINDSKREVSEYWIYKFLDSDFEITSKTGTGMLAKAIKEAVKSSKEYEIKRDLLSFATLLSRSEKGRITINKLFHDMGISKDLSELIISKYPNRNYLDSSFDFDKDEFKKNAVFKSVYLDNGCILTAETDVFEDMIDQEPVDEENGVYKYTTQGKEVDVKVKVRA